MNPNEPRRLCRHKNKSGARCRQWAVPPDYICCGLPAHAATCQQPGQMYDPQEIQQLDLRQQIQVQIAELSGELDRLRKGLANLELNEQLKRAQAKAKTKSPSGSGGRGGGVGRGQV